MKLIQSILAQEKLYCPPACFELAGEKVEADGVTWNLDGMPCIKCEEDAYLIQTEGDCVFYDRAAGEAFLASKTAGVPYCEDLDGWTAELAYAPLTVAVCDFEKGGICVDEEKLPIFCRKLREKLYLISAETENGKAALVVDLSRFLFYGVVCGKRLSGYFKNIKVDR